ncbi:hypothetical protein PT974_07188 [Cladobotryum mycophilum]|uniref:Uncharacterized protein n=1 Tax=Cladobotryum mycophilum TaxID=491253 RepID=A0ABR0SPP9_9HYPO
MPPNPNPSLDYPFYHDLREAILSITMQNLLTRLSYLPTGLVYLPLPSTSSAPAAGAPRQTTPLTPASCGGPWEQETSKSHLFCFDPKTAVYSAMNWIMQPRTLIQADKSLNREEARVLQSCIIDYDLQVPVTGPRGPVAERYDALCRLMVDMRREEIPFQARSGPSWSMERVHAILGWHGKTFMACINELKTAMTKVAEERLNRESREGRRASQSR